MKAIALVISLLISVVGNANSNTIEITLPEFTDIARNADGSTYAMTQRDAEAYCANQGMHLPNARELAQLAMSLGAQGILEIEDIGPSGRFASEVDAYAAGYGKICPAKGKSFYFSFQGYTRPVGELGKNWFWSASGGPWYDDYFYALDGENGNFTYRQFGNDRTRLHAVRCVIVH